MLWTLFSAIFSQLGRYQRINWRFYWNQCDDIYSAVILCSKNSYFYHFFANF
jgi:hypothetical protein